MGHISKELSAKEKPAASLKTFMNVFRPIREWLHQSRQPKTSTPISAPILRSSSSNGHLRGHIQNASHSISNNTQTNNTNTSNNSYGSLTGSSADMLSSTNPTPTQQLQSQQPHHSTLQHRFTPLPNGGHNGIQSDEGGGGGGGSSMMNSLDDQLHGSVRLENSNDNSFMGSTLEINQQFSRSAQARMSLPIMQQNKLRRQAYSQLQRRGQHQVSRSMGHIYLQHKGETKQPHVKIYIYNPSCNIFYELCDIEDVRHESVLRIHHSDAVSPQMSLAPQLSMAALGPVHIGAVPQLAHNPYHTLHRIPARIPPQMLMPQQQQHQQQHQQQQHLHQTQLQQQQVQPPSQMSLGPIPMMPHHMMQQPMITSQFQKQQQAPVQHPVHLQHTLSGPAMPHLSQIPPPKPRRMIPASYSMQRLQVHSSQ